MTYDLEKYREKREKVLGVKKRGLSFGVLAAIVSLVIVSGLGIVVIPKSIAYFHARHLDDAIYKLQGETTWTRELVARVETLDGVSSTAVDGGGSRLVVTFNRSRTDAGKLTAFFHHQGLAVVMLNQVGHSQRLHAMEKEAKF